jgi:hypothetical protein
MLDKSIDGALLALRKQIIRGDGAGLEHVEALLALRGVALSRVRAPWREDVGRRGETRRVLLRALADGPRTAPQLAAVVRAWKPDLPALLAYQRTIHALYRLKAAGLVGREGRVWSLVTPPAASTPSTPG